jgi:hypothetical protein
MSKSSPGSSFEYMFKLSFEENNNASREKCKAKWMVE